MIIFPIFQIIIYIRPILEYNCNAWSPHLISDIKRIESIQAKFTRKLCQSLNIKYNSYTHRLEILNLESLELRRIKMDIILLYKIINNLIDLEFNKFFTANILPQNFNLRRHELQIYKPKHPNTSKRSQFFSYRIISLWNQLPSDLICSNSLSIFKLKLDKVDLYKYFSPVI